MTIDKAIAFFQERVICSKTYDDMGEYTEALKLGIEALEMQKELKRDGVDDYLIKELRDEID